MVEIAQYCLLAAVKILDRGQDLGISNVKKKVYIIVKLRRVQILGHQCSGEIKINKYE